LVSSPRLKLLAQKWYDMDADSDDEVEEGKPDPPSSDAEDVGDTKPAAKPTPVKKKPSRGSKPAAKPTPVKKKPSRANPPRMAKSPSQAQAQVQVQPNKTPPKKNPPRSLFAKQLWNQTNNPSAKKFVKNPAQDDDSVTEVQVVEFKPELLTNELPTIPMTEAWKKGGEPRTLLCKNKVFRMIYPYLKCQECLHFGEMSIIIGESRYEETKEIPR
jgi:hypothetical protein